MSGISSSQSSSSSCGFKETYPVLDCKDLSLSEITETSYYKSLLEELKKKPKVELHAHLGGAIPKEFIRAKVSPGEYLELVQFIENIKSGMDYSKVFEAFIMTGRALQNCADIESAAFHFCEQQYLENVVFSELRTGLKRLAGKGFEECLQAVIAGLEKGMRSYPIQVSLLLSLRRDTSPRDAEETIDLARKYQGEIVRGIDVSGQSIQGDGSGIFEALKKARAHKLPITLHLGENPQETAEQQIKELREIEPARIGHAVFLCSEARAWIEERGTPVEACIRSALSVSMIKKPSDHPALELLKKGHTVFFCTDDSTLFGDLSEELALAACVCGLSLQEVLELQEKAKTHAFPSLNG